jgi:hypothetical protein
MFGRKRHPTRSDSHAHSDRRHRHRWRTTAIVLLGLVILLGIGRAILPWVVRDYVNRTLDRNQLYSGKIGNVRIQLVRGAYSIEDISISKTTGNVPVPFFAARKVDFSIQWNALLNRKAVGKIIMEQPELNFVDAPTEGESQTGADAPWLQIIRDLFPFKINSAIVKNGTIHFRAFQTDKPVDVYLSDVEAIIDNLTNIRDETDPLISTVQATALAMDQAKFEYKMAFDPFSYRPTFHMAARLMGLDVTKINDLALAYGKFDFKRGWLDFVMESEAQEGLLKGYAKPLFRDLKIFSLTQDLKDDNVLQFFWQALVGAVTAVLSNQSRDQFGTLIPFTGDLTSTTTTDILATLGNILRNAFVRAYLPRLESGQEAIKGLMFEPPDFTSAISTSDSP